MQYERENSVEIGFADFLQEIFKLLMMTVRYLGYGASIPAIDLRNVVRGIFGRIGFEEHL